MTNPKWALRRWWKRVRVLILRLRDGDRCAYCECHMIQAHRAKRAGWVNEPTWSRRMTLDHVMPRSRGGTSRLKNLVLACATCNHRKGSLTVLEYLGTMRFQQRWDSIRAEEARRD